RGGRSRTEVAECRPNSFFERCVWHRLAERCCVPRLVGAESEASEPGDHVSFGVACRGRYPRAEAPRPCGFLPLSAHELLPEHALGQILIVCPASESDVLHG